MTAYFLVVMELKIPDMRDINTHGTADENQFSLSLSRMRGESFRDCRSSNSSVYRRDGNNVYVNLVVDVADIEIEWLKIKRRVYNGNLCGPTIRMKPGDTVYVHLENRLGPDQPEKELNEIRHPNTTNIHTHGLHISSLPPGDDVFTRVDPGKSHNYSVNVNVNQPAGTYWYHAHWHGSTFFQVMSGLSGMLIVDDESTNMDVELDAVSCPNHCEHDVDILLQSTLQYTNDSVDFIHEAQEQIGDPFRLNKSTEDWLMNVENGFDYFTTNGLYNPMLTIQKNQMKRFRIVNAGGYVGLELEIANNGGTGQCVIREIAFDGVYLDAPRKQIYQQTYVAIAARVDWMIYCDTPGIYQLRSMSLPDGEWSIGTFRRYNGTFLTINNIESTLSVPSFSTALPTRQEFISDLRNINNVPEENKFIVELSDDFFMNRQKFVKKEDYRHRMEVGSVQEWTFVNSAQRAPHPLHIHVNHFQVISYNDYTGPLSGRSQHYFSEYPTFVLRSQKGDLCNDTYAIPSLQYEDPNFIWPDHPDKKFINHRKRWEALEQGAENGKSVGYAKRGDWRDVINVPPYSNITVRFNVHEYDGPVVMHCHVLKHEDLGMMLTVDSVKEKQNKKDWMEKKLQLLFYSLSVLYQLYLVQCLFFYIVRQKHLLRIWSL
uniref:multicopper oxidase mco-like n=1 Tax=Styela clava TaxID=7725 RepID=UPI00193A1235|nr:multicopper oxidase mco-like [Styela clava]